MASFVKEELQDMLDEQRLLARQTEAKARQQQERQYVSAQMAELQDEPRWRIYVQHINALKEPHVNRAMVLQKHLDNAGYLDHSEYNKTKFELVKEKATADALEIAKNLVFNLIEQGKIKE